MTRKRANKENELIARICPVCGGHKFTEVFEICPICNWENDYVQEQNPEWRNCANEMSLNDARQAYLGGKKVC